MSSSEGKFTQAIEKHLLPLANKIQRQKYLQALQNAFLTFMPLTIIGSLATIIISPFYDYTTMSQTASSYAFFKAWGVFVENYGGPFALLNAATLGSISLYTAMGCSYFLARHYKINTIISPILTIVTFLLLDSSSVDGGFSTAFFGGEGLFAAILIAIFVTEFYRFLITKKIGDISLPESAPPVLRQSFSSLFPIGIVALSATALTYVFHYVVQIPFPQAILNCFHPLVVATDNVFGAGLCALLAQFCWWFGIHDTAVTSIMEPFLMSNYAINAKMFAAGTPAAQLPHIFTEPFFWNFVTIGGSGATLALVLLLVRSRSKHLKTVGRLGLIPAFFNINEPVLFGLPVILNPLFLVPFVLAEVFNSVATYLVMAANLVNKPYIYPGWNIPTPIQQFLATMDWRAAVWAILLVVLDGVIYYPFVKVFENQKLAEENEADSMTQGASAPAKASEK
ncbi:PTS sugar transporter subunit IIC [Caproiciproducens sp.]|uniref:PTS sugar transporter subunit IIC n=1 Tax=Caproiciproducens sp. TaxID=1954376 RepID=UPI00289928E3|nr:PTS transporter subunit EIIC [Caproiciproducens sp.]